MALSVAAGLIVEALVLLVAKWKENVPKLVAQTRERFQINLNESVRQTTETELRAYQLRH